MVTTDSGIKLKIYLSLSYEGDLYSMRIIYSESGTYIPPNTDCVVLITIIVQNFQFSSDTWKQHFRARYLNVQYCACAQLPGCDVTCSPWKPGPSGRWAAACSGGDVNNVGQWVSSLMNKPPVTKLFYRLRLIPARLFFSLGCPCLRPET